jgi:hypothetical protein
MYEFHGWMTLRETYENRDTDEKVIESIVQEIKLHIKNINWKHGLIDIRPINVEIYLWMVGASNHKPSGIYSPVDFYEYIAKVAPGSYGLLYVLDDEDMANDNYNNFKVYVLARGKLTERKDPFLSPFIPTVETFPID